MADELKKIYQIEVTKGRSNGGMMSSLYSFQVFASESDARKYAQLYGYGEGVWEYRIVEYNPDDIEDYTLVDMNEVLGGVVDEVCPHCDSEVELRRDFTVQVCPVCGRHIIPCNLCDHNLCDCTDCPLLSACSLTERKTQETEVVRSSEPETYYNIHYPVNTEKSVERVRNRLNMAISLLHKGERSNIDVLTEDGETTYGMEIVNVLDSDMLVVGMLGNGQCKAFDVSSEAEDAIDWLLEDMATAVGEEFTICIRKPVNV